MTIDLRTQKGVTLIELLVSLAIASIVMAAFFAMYEAQVRGQVSQEVLLDMQQDARAALELMTEEIRTARSDPTGDADSEITLASSASLTFSRDITGGESDGTDNDNDGDVDEAGEDAYFDGESDDPNENITYALTDDADADGVADDISNGGTQCNLGRNTGAGLQPMSLNVDALDLVYFDYEENRLGDPVPNNDLDDIRSVQVTLVIRSGQAIRGLLRTYTDTTQYLNPFGDVVLDSQNDSFRRLQVTRRVFLRN